MAHAVSRPVEPRHLGFTRIGQARQSLELPATAASTVATVTGLWKDAMDRRAMLHGSAAFAAALALESAVDWRFTPTARTLRRDHGTVQVTDADIERLHAASRRFRHLDHTHGGGHALTATENYLHSEVSPLLAGRYSDRIGRDLFPAPRPCSPRSPPGWPWTPDTTARPALLHPGHGTGLPRRGHSGTARW